MKPLIEYCTGAVKSLRAHYETTNVLGHSATSGAAREKLIQDFLISHIPQMTSVLSGVIFDSKGSRSKQQDIVLVHKSMPRLPFASGSDLIFQEGVAATFEIKTRIHPSTLGKIGENIASVKSLTPSSLGGARLGDLDFPHGIILCVILTYGGAPLSKIEEKLRELPENQRPDIYFDLSKGIIIKNEKFLLLEPTTGAHCIIHDAAIGLAHFLRILTKYAGTLEFREVKWGEYIS